MKKTILRAAAAMTALAGFSAPVQAQSDPMVEQCAATYQFVSIMVLVAKSPEGKVEALSDQDKRLVATLYIRGKDVLLAGGVIKSMEEDYPQNITDSAMKLADTIGDEAGVKALSEKWDACDKHFNFEPVTLG